MSAKLPPESAVEVIRREILLEGLVDWVSLNQIDYFVRTHAGPGDDATYVAIGLKVIRQLVAEGLMEIGEVTDSGYRRWPGPVEADLERIRQGWRDRERGGWGHFVWFNVTPTGEELAEGLRSSRQGSDE